MKVHVETWVATALLHREKPQRETFTKEEILDRAHELHPGISCRPGVSIHVSQHCVANTRPNPARHRMLYREINSTYRLFRRGDDYHPDREKGGATPKKKDLPESYWDLLDWYRSEYDAAGNPASARDPNEDPLLQLVGLGKDLWKSLGGGDAVIRYLRSDTPTTPPWELAESKAENDQSPPNKMQRGGEANTRS